MSSVSDSFFNCCSFQAHMSPVPYDIRTKTLESPTMIPVTSLPNEVVSTSVVLPIPEARNFPMNFNGNDDIQELCSLHTTSAPVLPTTDVLPSPRLSAIPATVPLVLIDDMNTRIQESQNEELKFTFCHSQLNNNNSNTSYNNSNGDGNYDNNSTNTNDSTATTTTISTSSTIFDINSNSNNNNGDGIDFDFDNMANRNQIFLMKPNCFETSCSSSDIYGDNDWSVKVANTNLYQQQQQPYLHYSNTLRTEIPDVTSLPASLNSYDRCKTITEICHHNWWEINPDLWNLRELLDWMAYTLQLDKINSIIYLNNFFRDVKNGSQMRRMTREELISRDPDNGSMLFHSLKHFSEYGNILFDGNNQLASPKEYYSVECIKDAHCSMEMNDSKLDTLYPLEFGRYPLQPHQQHHTATMNSSNIVMPKLETSLLGEFINQNRTDDSVRSFQLITNSDRDIPMHNNNEEKVFQSCQPKRKPGRPRLHPLNKDSVGIKKMKILPLWEFIYSILQNTNFNPFIIRWEDEANGKFRFVHSEKFAKLWGEAKNNENMNYEKLSRAMRHYYGKDIIERVEGRRLVYRFLNSAMDRLRKKTNPEIPLSELQRS